MYPAIVRVLRLGRAPAGRGVAVIDADGSETTYAAIPNALPIAVELGDRTRVTASDKYYVHVVATLGTLAEREADELGDAVFGSESEATGLGSLGRMVFKTALKVGDYLLSVSAEAKSRKLAGADTGRPLRDRYGASANATMALPEGAPFLPPPHTITTYCRPSIV